MKALVVQAGAVALVSRPRPEPGPGEALVGVRLAGVCSTDLEIVAGYAAHDGVLGHEMVGQVLAHPDAAWVGRRVAVEINAVCGGCEACRRGDATHCAHRTVMGIRGRDGCLTEAVAMPTANLHALPDEVDDDAAVFVEPLAAAFRIGAQLDLRPDDRIAVVGDGKLGLLVAMALRAEGLAPILFGRHDRKRKLAEATGIATRGADEDLAPHWDVVVDATGSAAGRAAALARVRPRGTLVLKSTVAADGALDLDRIVVDEIRVLGSRCGPFDRAIAALHRGEVDPRPLIDARVPLAQGVDAFTRAATSGTLKVLVAP